MPIWNRKDIVVADWKINWWQFNRRRCAQRILVVTDWADSFSPGSFTGLTELIRVLEGNGDVPAAVAATVTKVSTASGFSFKSAAPAVTTANYDQVWLFGFQPGLASTDADETRVLAKFMQDGGGVFATGDHSDIGRPLCGALPRVRKMREWSAVPMGGPTRIDTVNHPGINGVANDADQSDRFPQTTYPLIDASNAPHPLLRSSAGPINVLPDHPHESECYAPRGAALGGDFNVAGMAAFPEFPEVGGAPNGPEIVAVSMSASLNVDKGPVAPRCFGAISAYNGHLANVGRVVCDSTWHHFVNMNLNSSNPYRDVGLREGVPLAANAAYKQIQRYYANIADYLTPKNRKWCRLFDIVATELFDYPIFEEIITLPPIPPRFPDFPDWPRAVELGKLVQSSLDRKQGRGTFTSLVEDILDVARFDENIYSAFNTGLHGAVAIDKKRDGLSYDDHHGLAELKLGLVGHVFLALKRELPEHPGDLVAVAEKLHDHGERLVADSSAKFLLEGIEYRRKSYQHDLEMLDAFAASIVRNGRQSAV